jgi:hypothetical protein
MEYFFGWSEQFATLIIIIIIIIFIYVGVRASLRAPRLIPRPTEHPANLVGM